MSAIHKTRFFSLLMILFLLVLAAPGHAGTIDVAISANADDAEEQGDSSVYDYSVDMDMMYDTWGSDDNQRAVGLRFNNVLIPQGATITNAYIQFRVSATNSTAVNLQIQGHDIDNASAFTTGNGNITGRTRTSATVAWSPAAWSTVGELKQTADLSSVVGEIVGRGGWSSGNSMVFIITKVSGSGYRVAQSANGGYNSILHVEYNFQDVPVAGSSDDAEERLSNGSMYLNSSDLEMINDDGTNQIIGIRFTGINVPFGADITSAYIRFKADGSTSTATNLVLKGQNSTDAATFTSAAWNISSRPTTAASVNWNAIPSWSDNSYYNSLDLSAIVEEIVNTPGWAEGQALAFIITGNSGGRRRADSVDGGAAPQLHLEFNLPAGGPTADTITPLTGSPTNNDSIVYAVTFSEAVQNFNAFNDLVLTSTGSLAATGVATFAGGPQNYTVSVSVNNGDGTIRLAVANDSDVRNLAAVALESSVTSAAVSVDNTAPIASVITPLTASPTNNDTIAFAVSFTENVVNFNSSADLVLSTTGTVANTGASISGGPKDYTVSLTGVSGDGTIALAVKTPAAGSDVRDQAGNDLASSVTSSQVVLLGLPMATSITRITASPTNADSILFSVHFNEPVQNFNDTSDMVIFANDTVTYTGAGIAGGPQDYTVSITGVNGDGTLKLTVSLTSDIQDLTANPLFSSVTSAAVVLDNTAPSAAAITPVTASPSNTVSPVFTVIFSEAVQGFNALADLEINATGTVTYSGATFAGGPTTYTVTVTGVGGDGDLSLAVSTLTDVADLAGNDLASSVTSSTIVLDHTAPTASAIDAVGISGTTATFEVTFSESVTNFDAAADVTVSTSSLSYTGVTISGGPTVYTVQVTGLDPGSDNTGTLNLRVNTGTGVADAAGNPLASSVTSTNLGFYATSVSSSSNDAEERMSDGNMYLDSVDLDMTLDDYDNNTKYTGIRFQDLTFLPAKAKITRAYIKFQARASDSAATNLTIYGQDIDDAPDFSSSDYNISSRTRTSASTNWSSIASWSDGSYYNTPDLSAILQELVMRPGWASDDIVFIIDGSGQRVAASEDSDGTPARLYLEYSLTPFSYIEVTPASLAPMVAVGNDAAPSSFTLANPGQADLHYTISDNDSWLSVSPASGTIASDANDTITVNYSTAALAIGTYTAKITISDPDALNNPQVIRVTLRVRGTPVISLSPTSLSPSGLEGSDASAGSFTITNTGNDQLDFTITTNDSWLSTSPASGTTAAGGGSTAITVNYDTNLLAPGIYTSYIFVTDPYASNSPQTITVTLNVLGVVNIDVANNSDDAEEDVASGDMSLYSSDLELVKDGSDSQVIGIRFTGINIPRAAVITQAYIRFTIDEAQSEYTDLYIYGQAADDPGTFTTTDSNISSRSKTATSVHWQSLPTWTAGDIGQTRDTPELSTVVQTLVNRAGWNPGNDMVFIIEGVGHRTVHSKDYSGSGEPELHIQYMLGSFPIIELSKSSITAQAFEGTAADNDSFILTNVGNADLDYTVSISYTEGSGWLATSISNDSLAPDASQAITVSFDTTGLTIGTYHATILVTGIDALNSGSIAVTLNITGPMPEITVDPNYLGAVAYEGNNAVPDNFRLSNTGTADLNYTLTINYGATTGWLGLNPITGTLAPGAFTNIAVTYNNSGFMPATYEATIVINGTPAASNNPVEVAVSLLVQALPVGSSCGDVPVYTENLVSPAILILLDISGSMSYLTTIADPIAVPVSTDIKTVIQEIVNQAGWGFGNDLALIISGSSTNYRIATSYDSAPDVAPLLHLTYGSPASEVNIRVSQSSDDAEQKTSNGSVDLTSADLDLIYDATTSSQQIVGLRFRGLPINQGTIITAATLEFMIDTSSINAVSLTIRGEKVADAITFNSTSNDISSRPTTTASVAWSPANWTSGTKKTKLQAGKDVISELVKDRSVAWGFGTWTFNHPGPTSGGTKAVPLGDNDTGWYYAGNPTDLWTKILVGSKFNDDTHQTNLQTAIASPSAGGNTPLGPSMVAAREYFQGNKLDLTYTEAFSSVECQPKFVIEITDGLGQSPWTDQDKMKWFTNDLYDDGISAVGVGFGIDDGIQIEQLAITANARGKASTEDTVYALHEEVGGVGVPYLANSSFQLLTALRDVTASVKAQVFHGSAPAPTTSIEYGDIVITAKFDAASWNGNLIALRSANDSFSIPMWEANDSINNTLRGGGSIDAWTVNAETGPAVRYTDATLAGDNFMCKVLGDIINSAPEIVESPPFSYPFDNYYLNFKYNSAVRNRPRLIYIGANDGALHAFNLNDGTELWRFYPTASQSKLDQATSDHTYDMCDIEYCHKYFVDGSPVAADIYAFRPSLGHRSWQTILLTGMREGGEALFALDVTSGNTFNDSVTDPTRYTTFLWEFTDTELGQTWSKPAVARVSDGNDSEWGTFFGSGYSALAQASKQSYLYGLVSYDGTPMWRNSVGADTNRIKMYTTSKPNDALASPLVADRDFDYQGETLYVGNLLGTMFRVTDFGKDEVPVVSNPPFFSFTYENRHNPIRAAADYVFGEENNSIWVYFGTGKYDDQIDKTTMAMNYFFGLKDNDSALSYTLDDSGSPMVFTVSSGGGTAILAADYITDNESNTYRTISGANANKRPWMVKLDNSSAGMVGSERVISKPLVVAGTVFFATFIPDQNICAGNGQAWLYALDYDTGLAPETPVFDINNDHLYNDDDKVNGQNVAAIPLPPGQPSEPVLHKDMVLLTTTGSEDVIVKKVNLSLNAATVKAWKDTKVK